MEAKVNHSFLNQFVKQSIELSLNKHDINQRNDEFNYKLLKSPYLSVLKTKDINT